MTVKSPADVMQLGIAVFVGIVTAALGCVFTKLLNRDDEKDTKEHKDGE